MNSRESGIGNRESAKRSASPASRFSESRIPNPQFRTRGFTLVEMMAIIVLIGVVLSVSALSLSRSLDSAKVQAASRDLVAALRYTRGQAIVKGQSQTLELNLADNTYQAPGRPVTALPKDMTLRLTTAAQEQVSEHSGRIRFFADGSSTGGNIAVLMGRRDWRINVGWLTGEVTLDKPENEE